MAESPKQRMIPARYIGHHSVYVPPRDRNRAYVHDDGTPLDLQERVVNITPDLKVEKAQVFTLHPRDTILMPEGEILGQTYLVDPTHQQPPIWRGWGWRPEPKHVGLFPHQLHDMRFKGPDGTIRHYEFHEGRSDFEPVNPASEPHYYRYPSEEERWATREADAQALADAELIDQKLEAEARLEATPQVPGPVEALPVETPAAPETSPTSSKRRSASTPESDATEA